MSTMTTSSSRLPTHPSKAADMAADVQLLMSSGLTARGARLLGTLPGLIQRELVELVGHARRAARATSHAPNYR
jgi:hypothetical protein